MKRYLALFFPRWPIQHLRRLHPDTEKQPVALFERSQRGSHLRVCSVEANALNIRGGMSVADAKSTAPELQLYELNLAECRSALEELCLWTTRFSPLAALESLGPHALLPQTVLLDISGCQDVFDGEEKLLSLAVSSLKKLGYKVRAAIAPTVGAAWALSHFGPLESIAPHEPERLKEVLIPIPLAGLRLATETLDDFRPLGLNRIGDILRQPRASLPSRFGKELTERLDQAFDVVPEPLIPLRPAPEFRAARVFEYPVRSSEMLFKILEQLVAGLASALKKAQRGARHIECWLYHELSVPVCAEIALHRCSYSRKHLWQLLRARLEDLFRIPTQSGARKFRRKSLHAKNDVLIEVDESIEAVAIHVTTSESLAEQQLPLFERAKDNDVGGELSLLLDRLVTRLGSATVCRVQLEDDRLPECAFRLLRLDEKMRPAADVRKEESPRPLRLLPRPQSAQMDWPHAFSCEGRHHAIRRVTGAERIESGWWRERDQRRNYYIVEVESGARYWLFEDLTEHRWFVHGSFD